MHLLWTARQCDANIAHMLQPLASFFLETKLYDFAHAWRRLVLKATPIRFRTDDGSENVRGVLALEGPLAREGFVQTASEGPYVGAAVDGMSSRLLGAHVGGGAHDDAEGGSFGEGWGLRRFRGNVLLGGDGLREAEIKDLDLPVRSDFDVRGLQVAVNDAFFVRRFQAVSDLYK